MLQNRATSEEAYERFAQRVRKRREIWGLRSPEAGWAFCPSHEEESTDVLVFWSDRAYAARHQKEEWQDYIPTAIPFDVFVDRWLKGMERDGLLVGPNWDAHLCGLELKPREVAERLLRK